MAAWWALKPLISRRTFLFCILLLNQVSQLSIITVVIQAFLLCLQCMFNKLILMRAFAKQQGCSDILIIHRGILLEPSALEQFTRESLAFCFLVPDWALVANIVSSIAFQKSPVLFILYTSFEG